MSFSSRRPSEMAVCSGLSAGANPAADRWCLFKGKRVFAVVGYCASSMKCRLSLPIAKSLLFGLLRHGSRAHCPCSCRSHEHVLALPHALAGGGVRPAFTGHVASSCLLKNVPAWNQSDPYTHQLFQQSEPLDASRCSAGFLGVCAYSDVGPGL